MYLIEDKLWDIRFYLLMLRYDLLILKCNLKVAILKYQIGRIESRQ